MKRLILLVSLVIACALNGAERVKDLNVTGNLTLSNPLGTAYGGLGVVLTDPNADRLLFWDDSAGAYAYLTLSGLSISGTTLSLDATLGGMASVTIDTAGQMFYATGTDTFSTVLSTAAGRSMLSAADATAQKTLLSLNNVENTALSSWAGTANIVTLGTVVTGTWNATTITTAKGGTGFSAGYTKGDLLVATDATTLVKLAVGTNTHVLTADSAETAGMKWAAGSAGTVTHTGGALTANAIALGAGGADLKVVAGITTDGTSALNLGAAGSSVGKVVFANATSGTITLQPVTGALGTVTLSLPAVTDTLAGIAATQTLTNKTLGSSTSVTAAISFTAGVKQTFAPDATNSGLNVGSFAGVPSSLANGDLFYDSTANALKARINGSTVSLGAGGGGGTPGGSDTQVQFNNAGSFGGISGLTSDGTNMTAGSGNLRATSPRITTALLDSNGNELFLLTATASAVNELTYANAATGNAPTFTASGGDTNIGITLVPKGTGRVQASGELRATGSLIATGFTSIGTGDIMNIGVSSTEGYLEALSGGAGMPLNIVSSITKFLNSSFVETARFTTARNVLIGGTSETGLTGAGGLRVFSTTASTTAATGSAIIDGGLGVAKSINAGESIVARGFTTTSSGDVMNMGVSSAQGYLEALTGGAGMPLNIVSSRTQFLDASFVETARFTTARNVLIGTTSETGLTGAGGFRVASTTEATSSTAGSAIISGGLAVAAKVITGSSIQTGAPSGGTAAAWKLGTVATVTATAPNRTLEVDVGGTLFYVHAKTTND